MYAPGTFDVSRARTPSTGILFAVSLGGDRDATEARCWFQHSIVKQSHSNRHDSSPLLFGGRGDRPHFPSLTGVRERSADWRYFLVAPYGARAFAGTPPPGAPLWRLPPRDRLVGSEPETFISVIRAAKAARITGTKVPGLDPTSRSQDGRRHSGAPGGGVPARARAP